MSTHGATTRSVAERPRAGSGGAVKADSVASLHERSRAWQANHPDASREVRPGGERVLQHSGTTVDPYKIHTDPVGNMQDIIAAYHEHQLGAALANRMSMDGLRSAAHAYGIQPGTSKADLVSRLTSHVTHGRYSADFGKNSASATRQSAAAKKSAAYESRIAKLEQQLAATRAEYEAHKAATGTGQQAGNATPPARATGGTPARTRSSRETASADVPSHARIDSQLGLQRDSTDPEEAWTRFGGTRQGMYDALKQEPLGALEAMARRASTPGGERPPHVTGRGSAADEALNRGRLASYIADTVARAHGQETADGGTRRGGRATAQSPMPPPIRTPGLNRQSPLHVVDPYELALDYGHNQLRNVISRVSGPNLKVAARLVKERNPGTKPAGQSNQALIDYIVRHVAGEGQ